MVDRCTICAAQIHDSDASLVSALDGRLFHFCSLICLKIFQAYPNAFMGKEEMELNLLEDTAY